MSEEPKNQQFLLGLFGGIAVIAIIGLIVLGITFIKVNKNQGAVNGGQVNNQNANTNTSVNANTNANNNVNTNTQTGDSSLADIKNLFNQDMIKFGQADSKNLIVEFSDPSCPYCSIASGLNPALNRQAGTRFILKSDGGSYVAPVPEIKKLVDEGRAGFIYVYLNGHDNGEMAAQALYCAYEKNKFWEAHELLMSAGGYNFMNGALKPTADSMATLLKSAVDEGFIKSCLSSGKYVSKLSRDASIAQKFGVSGTPGFLVNGQVFAGAYGFDDMSGALAK